MIKFKMCIQEKFTKKLYTRENNFSVYKIDAARQKTVLLKHSFSKDCVNIDMKIWYGLNINL